MKKIEKVIDGIHVTAQKDKTKTVWIVSTGAVKKEFNIHQWDVDAAMMYVAKQQKNAIENPFS